MKRLLTFLVIVACTSLNAQREFPNILERDSFPGVKSLEVTSYLLGFDENLDTVLSRHSFAAYEFDPAGAWIKKEGEFPAGDISVDSTWYEPKTLTRFLRRRNEYDPSTTSTIYNTRGQIVRILYDAEQRDDVEKIFEYDKKGRCIRRTETFMEQCTVEEYFYDKAGWMTRRTTSVGSVLETGRRMDAEQNYVYNSDGRVVQVFEIFYGAKDVISSRDTIWNDYNQQGLLVRQAESRQNGASQATTLYTYDEKGRLTVRDYHYTNINGKTSHVVTKAEYDAMGYCTHFSDEGDDYGFALNWNTNYNEKGLPVSCFYTTDSEIILYKWVYEMR